MSERESDSVTVLVMAPWLGADVSYVGIDPRVVVVDGSAALASELHDETPDGRAPAVGVPRAERDRLLGEAEVILVGYPVPRSIIGRAPHLRWAHHTQAGVSNLHRSDLWDSDVTLTSGRAPSRPERSRSTPWRRRCSSPAGSTRQPARSATGGSPAAATRCARSPVRRWA